MRRRAPEPTEQQGRPVAGHLIVCGADPLAYRLASELVTRHGRQVTVVLPDRRRNHGPQISRLAVRVIEAEHLDADAFRRARVATADTVTPARPAVSRRRPADHRCHARGPRSGGGGNFRLIESLHHS